MSEIPLGSSYLRFFAQGGAVDEPKFADDEPSALINVGEFAGATEQAPIDAIPSFEPNPDNVQIDIPEFYPDLENPVDLPEDLFSLREETTSAYEELEDADLQLRLEQATPLERHLYEVTGMEPGLDRATLLPFSGSKDGGDLEWSMPALIYDLAKVANAPGAVVQGIPVSDDETVELGMNVMGSGLAIGPSVEGAVAGMAIKNKGGNWLEGRVENAVELMRIEDPLLLLKNENIAFNRFLDTKVTKYIRNDMGTPNDPLRNLIDQGTLLPESPYAVPRGQESIDLARRVARNSREKEGFPAEGYATTELGRQFEDNVDNALSLNPARWFQEEAPADSYWKEFEAENPWIANLSPEDRVVNYYAYSGPQGITESMKGLAEILHETAEGTLPQHLSITPKDLDKMSMVQAVEKVAKVNQWRQKQVDNLAQAQLTNTATVPYREYDVIPNTGASNDKGLRWVELRLTEDTPEGIAAINEALAFEGSSMGHSVAGYRTPEAGGGRYYGLGGFEAIREGRARIYSLRDSKSNPHVTIEVSNGPDGPSITQIKGKQNQKPVEEYLPFVDDFVLSEDWLEVKDLSNTNVIDRDNLPYEQLTDPRLPDKTWFSQQELYDLFEADADRGINPEGFSHGGEVSKTAWEEINGY